MLVIRLQRTGRKKVAHFRIVVQDSRRTPTSGKIVAHLGHFNPHTKEIKIDKEQAVKYLSFGAQPSDRVVKILKDQKIKLPSWVKEPTKQTKKVRFPEKRRSTAPAQPESKEAPKEELEAESEIKEETSVKEVPSEEVKEEPEVIQAQEDKQE